MKLSIDEFGTGHSSLGSLKRFPLDMLKIDRSFVSGLGTDTEDAAIVTAIINLAHSLGLETIADGVETKEQVEELRTLGCDIGQGYYFARPRPSDAIARAAGLSLTPPLALRARRSKDQRAACARSDAHAATRLFPHRSGW